MTTAQSCQAVSRIEIAPSFSNPFRKTIFAMMKRPLGRLLCLPTLNSIYAALGGAEGPDAFMDNVLAAFNISCEVSREDLARIPAEGPLLVVANHPYGAIEGIILAKLMRQVRPDSKVMANSLLSCIPEMRDLLVFVDPFGTRSSTGKNIAPLKDALRWAKAGHALGVFPAGEVSSVNLRARQVMDPTWSPTVARIACAAGATILPVYFEGGNGLLFHLLGLVHPRLRTALLPRAMLKRRSTTVGVKIGKPIPAETLHAFGTDQAQSDYMRVRTYLLRGETGKRPRPSLRGASPLDRIARMEVASATDPDLLRLDRTTLPPEQVLLESGEFTVFHATRGQAPAITREIGRLREATFRAVGEGTGQSLDLDRFDDTYDHLVLWNEKSAEIAGAYRLGRADRILATEGVGGLYTSTLFDYPPELLERIGPAIELGRSFVTRRYQKSYAPLLLLWRGISQYLLRHPHYRALFGPVSISNDYHAISREIIVRYASEHSARPDLSSLVRPKTPPRLDAFRKLGANPFPAALKDLETMASLISDIEEDSKGVPVLLRHYLKLGGRILAFNVDRAFSNVLDGLILIDLADTDEKTLERYMGKDGARSYLARHGRIGERRKVA